jgi:hypothetical protein
MILPLLTPFVRVAATASLVAIGVFGPPRITVRQVTSRTPAPAGVVLLVEGRHHADSDPLTITGRAEGMRDGKRVTQPLTLVNAGNGVYGVTRQWTTGTPWVLVLSAGEGTNGAHGVAEALVRISANGAVGAIDYPAPGWVGKSDTPRRVTEGEIATVLAALHE